jgi:hypothetical protein
MRNGLDKSCKESQNSRFMFNNVLFSENLAFSEIRSINTVDPEGPKMTSQYSAYEFAYSISKATCTHAHAHANTTGYTHARAHIRNIYCFSTAAMFGERASVSRCTCIVCLVVIYCDGPIRPCTAYVLEDGG